MNPIFLFPFDPIDERRQPPQRIDVQREHLRHQRQLYNDLDRDLDIRDGRQRHLRESIRRPLLSARHAVGQALVAIGRHMTTDSPGDMGGASSASPGGPGAMRNQT
jgi:hypothetical protein